MLKILLIEDEQEKKRLILETILENEKISLEDIAQTDNALDAKKLLRTNYFNLVILDINIPPRSDRPAKTGGGLDVLSFIKTSSDVNRPGHVVGLTGYSISAEVATPEFKSMVWKLVEYSPSKSDWRQALKDALQFLSSERSIPPNDGNTYRCDVGIVTAVDEEFDALKSWPADWTDFHVKYDPLRYIEGRLETEGRTAHIVAVQAARMGLPAAAVAATSLINTCRPRYLVMIGICAGIRSKTKLGDIIVSDPCFDWGNGKWVQEKGSQEIRFRPAPYQWRLSEVLRSKFQRLKNDNSFLRKIYNDYERHKPGLAPTVHIEATASGGSVLQASKLVSDIIDQHKNLVGVDMENYSIFTAAELCSEPQPKCFVVKAVCDFGDEDKSDAVHEYAAYISAEFTREFIMREIVK